jgi:hypothetical protein
MSPGVQHDPGRWSSAVTLSWRPNSRLNRLSWYCFPQEEACSLSGPLDGTTICP